MKNIELSDDSYEALQRLASAKGLSPAEMLTVLLDAHRPISGDHLMFHLTGVSFSRSLDPADRYLALLAWVARHHTADFADFISHQASARGYLMLSQAEVNAIRHQHQARQIDGTQYWAIMDIDEATKGRFVRRLLEFIGCHDEAVAAALRTLSLPAGTTRRSPLLCVA